MRFGLFAWVESVTHTHTQSLFLCRLSVNRLKDCTSLKISSIARSTQLIASLINNRCTWYTTPTASWQVCNLQATSFFFLLSLLSLLPPAPILLFIFFFCTPFPSLSSIAKANSAVLARTDALFSRQAGQSALLTFVIYNPAGPRAKWA